MNNKKEVCLWFFIDWVIYIFVTLFLVLMNINKFEISNGQMFQIISDIFRTNNLLIIFLLIGIFTKGISFIINKILLKFLKIEADSLKLSFTISTSVILTLLIVNILLDFNLIQEGLISNVLICLISPIIMIYVLKEDFKNNVKLYVYSFCLMCCAAMFFLIL